MAEEKREAYVEAKKRVAGAAIKLATVAAVAAPSITTAQHTNTPEQNIEVSSAPSPVNTTHTENAQDVPAFGSNEWLEAQMQTDRSAYDAEVAGLSSPQITPNDVKFAEEMEVEMPEYLAGRQTVVDKLNKPVQTDENEYSGFVGNWQESLTSAYRLMANHNFTEKPVTDLEEVRNSEDFINYFRTYPQARDVPENPREMLSLKNGDYEIKDAPENPLEDDALAAYSPTNQKITIHNYPDKDKANVAGEQDHESAFIMGNPAARAATLYHEGTHMKHHLYDGNGELKKLPVNAAKADRLTETTAKAAEYLNIALQYSFMKEQGIQTIQTPQTNSLSAVFAEYQQAGTDKSFVEYMKEQNIHEISFNGQQISIDNLAKELPDLEQKLKNYDFFKKATVTIEDNGQTETASLSDFIIANSNIPFTEQLKMFDVTTVTIDGKELSVEELGAKYPELNKMAQDCNDIKQTYTHAIQEQPLESMLEFYPGLKEAIPPEGFNPENSEQVRAIVAASSEFWHQEYAEDYTSQATDAAEIASSRFGVYSWSEQLNMLKSQDQTYQTVSERMLQNIHIGQGQTVDLTGCRDLLDTMTTQEAQQIIATHNQTAGNDDIITMITYDEMKEVDTYLNSIGITTDEAKMQYMANFINSTINRTNEHPDPKLAEILMSHNPNIGYTDGLAVNYSKDNITCRDGSNNSYDITGFSTNPQLLKKNMRQDAQEHNANLQNIPTSHLPAHTEDNTTSQSQTPPVSLFLNMKQTSR